jgi:hypothetical protein
MADPRYTVDENELKIRFTFHPPKDDQQTTKYESIRRYAGEFAKFISETCPGSREKSLAITKLEECVMWANAAIARRE